VDSTGGYAIKTTLVIEGTRYKASERLSLKQVSARKVEFDYLRTFAVILVLFHHAIIAYTTFASINYENPIATSSPVVNEQRWSGFDLIVAFNEMYSMPLLFFISGIFVWQSLARRGVRKYVRSRLTRLGLPFVLGVLFLMPVAYYPAQLQVGMITGVDSSYGAFWLGMVRSGFGTAGPLWFLWLLLAFNLLAAFLYRVGPLDGSHIKDRLAVVIGHPAVFFGTVLGISIVTYVPLAVIIGPLKWIGIGPFNAQAGRIVLYLLYFLTGTLIGICGFDHRPFKSDGPLAKRWWVWFAVGLMSFVVFIIMIVVISPGDRTFVTEISFAVCCGTTVFGMTGLFLRFAKRRVKVFDSLSNNAYAIYIVHYVFVTWLQYFLLRSSLDPRVKGIVVFYAPYSLVGA
jgi:glucan biosynthesis protein C